MWLMLMGARGEIGFQTPFLYQNPPQFDARRRIGITIAFGLRNPRWRRSDFLSTEAIQAVQSLKLAKNPQKLGQVFDTRISRLLKDDLLDALTELQRQNELDLALKVCQVFEYLRNEVWYEPDQALFSDMMFMCGKNKLIDRVEQLFSQLKKEGLEPDTRAYTELIGAYLQVDMIQKAMETYDFMKASGCVPDKLTLTILIRNLEIAGEEQLASTIKIDCAEVLDFPKKFIKEVEKKYPKRRSINLV